MAYDYIRDRFENHRPQSGFTLPEMNEFLRGLLPLMHQARIGTLQESFFSIPKTAEAYAEKHDTTPEKARALFLKNPEIYIAHHAVVYFKKPLEKEVRVKDAPQKSPASIEPEEPKATAPSYVPPRRKALPERPPMTMDRDTIHAFELASALASAAKDGKSVTSLRGRMEGMNKTVSEIGYALKRGNVLDMDRVFPDLSPKDLPKTMTDFGVATGLYERSEGKVIAAPPERIAAAVTRLTSRPA